MNASQRYLAFLHKFKKCFLIEVRYPSVDFFVLEKKIKFLTEKYSDLYARHMRLKAQLYQAHQLGLMKMKKQSVSGFSQLDFLVSPEEEQQWLIKRM